MGDTVIGTVQAFNLVGPSTVSVPNTVGAVIMIAPSASVTNLARGANTGKTSVELTWSTLTSDDSGGSPADYQVWWDQGSSGAWSVLQTSTSGQGYFLNTQDFTTGYAYKFYIVAFNVVGSGPASSAITVLTGTAPAGLAAPTTDYDSGLMSTVVQWVPATDDGGLPPLIY